MLIMTPRNLIFGLCATLLALWFLPFAHIHNNLMQHSHAYSGWSAGFFSFMLPLSTLAVASLIWADKIRFAWFAMAAHIGIFASTIKSICEKSLLFSKVCGMGVSFSYGSIIYGLCTAALCVVLLTYQKPTKS
ncbi:MAG TPA: DUF202 domain-containing protein [Alcaligenes sp.]|nr:DUF202 domain-containing protein [Alcaligenes sp.]HRL27380.1 DUF202 domain-containing protein [Alcaligenes sp.]